MRLRKPSCQEDVVLRAESLLRVQPRRLRGGILAVVCSSEQIGNPGVELRSRFLFRGTQFPGELQRRSESEK